MAIHGSDHQKNDAHLHGYTWIWPSEKPCRSRAIHRSDTWVWQSVHLDLMIRSKCPIWQGCLSILYLRWLLGSDNQSTWIWWSDQRAQFDRVASLFLYLRRRWLTHGWTSWIWQSVQAPNLGKQWQLSLHKDLKSFLPLSGNFVICIISICCKIINE